MFKKIVWLGFSSKWKNAKDVSKYIKSLVDSGAGEFFTWYNPSYWHEKFWFEVSTNGRFAEHEQIADFDTLKAIVDDVHGYDLEIFWNANFRYYTDETFTLIERMIEDFQKAWVDWIICWNIWVLEYLKKIGYKWKINISTILAIYNSESIRFLLENYDINKIILSREITLKEIEKLVTDFPDTIFEVFGEGDFCRYNNGLCFAEHKYGDKDICTVVVNDLVFKKRFRPDFKRLIADAQKDNFEKMQELDDCYKDEFQQIDNLMEQIDLWFTKDVEKTRDDIYILVRILEKRVDLFYDALKGISDFRNQKILNLLKILRVIEEYSDEFVDLRKYLEDNVKSGVEYYFSELKKLWYWKLKALEVWNFYARWDNLNLYSYMFFAKFKNIDTVKFPTRWRNYSEKINVIENTVRSWEIDSALINRSSSIERSHYDLTYLFGDRLWFRNMIKSL